MVRTLAGRGGGDNVLAEVYALSVGDKIALQTPLTKYAQLGQSTVLT